MAEENRGFDQVGDIRPIPDPTRQTSAVLTREIASLRELVTAMLGGLDDKLRTRMDAYDKAINLIQSAADRIPSEVDMKVSNLQALHAERLVALEQQISLRFMELDKRLEQEQRSSSTAVSAALLAARDAVHQQNVAFAESVSKAEKATEKSIDQLVQMNRTTTSSLNEKIDAAMARSETAVASLRAELLPQITGERTRGDRGEGRQIGQAALIAIIFSAIATLGTIGTIIGFVITLLRKA